MVLQLGCVQGILKVILDIGVVVRVADIFYALVRRRVRSDTQLGLLPEVVHDIEVFGLLAALLYHALDARLPIG